MLLDDFRFLLRGSLNRRESIANRGRQLLAQTWYRAFGVGPRVFANSIPKSGTHLLLRCLDLLPGLTRSGYFISHIHHHNRLQDVRDRQAQLRRVGAGCFVGAHMPYTPENARLLAEMAYKHVLIIRDPRDVVVSHFHHIQKRKVNRLHDYLASLPDDEARLMALIEGVPDAAVTGGVGQPGIAQEFQRFVAWQQAGAHVIRFEDLIGAAGGGTAARQLAALADLTAFLGLSLDELTLQAVAQQLFYRQANTFRKGAIGDWRNYLSAAQRQAVQRELEPLLAAYGYERDGAELFVVAAPFAPKEDA